MLGIKIENTFTGFWGGCNKRDFVSSSIAGEIGCLRFEEGNQRRTFDYFVAQGNVPDRVELPSGLLRIAHYSILELRRLKEELFVAHRHNQVAQLEDCKISRHVD